MPHSAARLVAALTPESEPTDADLLARFATDRDAGAFELLVWRHAGLVLRTCRAVLRDHHTAEDAAQAVFLALARQASSVGRSGSTAGWLFRVARRVATRACPRVPLSASGADLDAIPAPDPKPAPDPDLERMLHEELIRLPARYRVPVLLCFFEGLTHAEAARRLGWPVGTIASRIARAKELLGVRLARRGVPLSLVAPVVIAIPPSFVTATTRAAVEFVGRGNPVVPDSVLELAKREIRMTWVEKLLPGIVAVTVCCGLALGLRSSAEPPAPTTPKPASAERPLVQKPPAAVVEKTFALAPITTELQRRLIYGAGPNSTTVLMVDATALFKDPKTLDVEAFQLSELRKGLRTFQPEKGKSLAHFAIHYKTGSETSNNGQELLSFALHGAAMSEGFVPGTPPGFGTTHNGPFEFDKYVAPLKDDQGAGDTENGVGDKRVQAYPVRTPLSRVLTGSVGGVVEVQTLLDCRGENWIPDEVDKSVKAAIEKLKLAKGQQLNFLLNIPGTKRDEHTQGRVRSACKRWAESSGLESGSISS